uniref:Uncharacterized protein n=1 Tax=Arundo donax TaxID=35708 RepID=A0A0A9FN98_ARUDO
MYPNFQHIWSQDEVQQQSDAPKEQVTDDEFFQVCHA